MHSAAPQVTITAEEYEALKARAPKQTITVDADEYNALIASKPTIERLKVENDRYAGRCRELETCLRREQAEHREEIEACHTVMRKHGIIKPPAK